MSRGRVLEQARSGRAPREDYRSESKDLDTTAIFNAVRLREYDLDHYGSSASRFRITDVTSGAWDPEGWEWCLTYPMWVALY